MRRMGKTKNNPHMYLISYLFSISNWIQLSNFIHHLYECILHHWRVQLYCMCYALCTVCCVLHSVFHTFFNFIKISKWIHSLWLMPRHFHIFIHVCLWAMNYRRCIYVSIIDTTTFLEKVNSLRFAIQYIELLLVYICVESSKSEKLRVDQFVKSHMSFRIWDSYDFIVMHISWRLRKLKNIFVWSVVMQTEFSNC